MSSSSVVSNCEKTTGGSSGSKPEKFKRGIKLRYILLPVTSSESSNKWLEILLNVLSGHFLRDGAERLDSSIADDGFLDHGERFKWSEDDVCMSRPADQRNETL